MPGWNYHIKKAVMDLGPFTNGVLGIAREKMGIFFYFT
jgi:hypothetical protein